MCGWLVIRTNRLRSADFSVETGEMPFSLFELLCGRRGSYYTATHIPHIYIHEYRKANPPYEFGIIEQMARRGVPHAVAYSANLSASKSKRFTPSCETKSNICEFLHPPSIFIYLFHRSRIFFSLTDNSFIRFQSLQVNIFLGDNSTLH